MVLFIGNSRLASPLGVREIRKSARRSCGFAIRRQKRFDLFKADLQSASSENAASRIGRYEKPTAADCKSAFKWSNLFCLRIANPQERLTDHNA